MSVMVESDIEAGCSESQTLVERRGESYMEQRWARGLLPRSHSLGKDTLPHELSRKKQREN